MTMQTITITEMKGLASIQDLGRNNALHQGFSGSGAADEYSFSLANQLLGNPRNTPALEISLGQFSFIANEPCEIVIAGANCTPSITNMAGKKRAVFNNSVIRLVKGDSLALLFPKTQLHTYIAIQGGFNTKQWLGSFSQTLTEKNLPFGEEALCVGRSLSFSARKDMIEPSIHPLTPSTKQRYFHQEGALTLRFLPSEQWLTTPSQIKRQLTQQTFKVLPDSNRMGYRLKANVTPLNSEVACLKPLLSKPVNYGTIQLPADGQPIILMKERQTIGGYPIIGTVIKTDLFRLSQKRPGEIVSFSPTSLAFAQAQYLAFQQTFLG